MNLLHAILLFPLMVACCFGPGFFIVRRWRASIEEKLCAAIAVSIILLYACTFLIYGLRMSWNVSWLISGISAILLGACRRDLIRFWSRKRFRQAVGMFAGLLALGLLQLMVTRHYSGGVWALDWLEHFQRAEFFLKRQPYDTIFGEVYALPARPPLMNLVAAGFLAQAGDRYDFFQLICLFLNTLVYFPCLLLARMLAPTRRQLAGIIAFFLACSPLFAVNTTWTWTKLLCAFFVILSVALYLRGWRGQSPIRIIGAAGSMAAGLLVHYSAGPYAVVLGIHYLFILRSRKHKSLELIGCFAAVAILLSTWFGWALAIYGPGTTVGSNTSVTGAQKLGFAQNIAKIALNTVDTIVPHPLRKSPLWFGDTFPQPNPFGFVRDYFFLLYQQNLLFAFGSAGWIAVAYITYRRIRIAQRSLGIFWIFMIGASIVLGIAVHGDSSWQGLAHICLQPLVLMGLTLLAGGFRQLSRRFQITLLAFLAFDVALGIVLHFRMQSLAMVYRKIGIKDVIPFSPGLLTMQPLHNSFYRFVEHIPYVADPFAKMSPLLFALIVLAYGAQIFLAARYAVASNVRARNDLVAYALMIGFAGMASVCCADRLAGYDVQSELADLPAPTDEEIRRTLEPYQSAIAATPESADAHYQLALACYKLGMHDDAYAELRNALMLSSYHREAGYLISVYDIIYDVKVGPEDPFAVVYQHRELESVQSRIQYGTLLFNRGFFKSSERVFGAAVQIDPSNAAPRLNHAIVLNKIGQRTEAVAECEQAIRLAPGDAVPERTLAAIMSEQGFTQDAINRRLLEIRAKR